MYEFVSMTSNSFVSNQPINSVCTKENKHIQSIDFSGKLNLNKSMTFKSTLINLPQ